jgi:hypothetical protein
MASAEVTFVNSKAGIKAEALEVITSYKGGAFKNQVTDAMTVVEIFHHLIASRLTTSKEKRMLHLGRSLVSPFDASLSGEEVLQRIQV